MKVSGDLSAREHLDFLHTIYHTYRSSFGYGNDDSHCSRNSCWFPSRAGSGGVGRTSLPSSIRCSLLFIKALPHLARLSVRAVQNQPTPHLRMLAPGSRCHCLPWLLLRRYQKPLEGLSTCPGWGSTGATGIKKNIIKTQQIADAPLCGQEGISHCKGKLQ